MSLPFSFFFFHVFMSYAALHFFNKIYKIKIYSIFPPQATRFPFSKWHIALLQKKIKIVFDSKIRLFRIRRYILFRYLIKTSLIAKRSLSSIAVTFLLTRPTLYTFLSTMVGTRKCSLLQLTLSKLYLFIYMTATFFMILFFFLIISCLSGRRRAILSYYKVLNFTT